MCGSPSVRPAASLPGAATQQRLEPGPMRSCAFVDEPLAFVRFVLVVVIAGARWRTAGRDAVLLVDGPFALRPELRGAWSTSIRLDTQEPPVDEAYRARPGTAHARVAEAQFRPTAE